MRKKNNLFAPQSLRKFGPSANSEIHLYGYIIINSSAEKTSPFKSRHPSSQSIIQQRRTSLSDRTMRIDILGFKEHRMVKEETTTVLKKSFRYFCRVYKTRLFQKNI